MTAVQKSSASSMTRIAQVWGSFTNASANDMACFNFPRTKLRATVALGFGGLVITAQAISRAPAVPYVAISHVWSDGTGAGVQKEGFVNRCLFRYFKEAMRELEPAARRKAIRRMNNDFRYAKCTLVHDQYLC
ncbi:hypothetical protein BDW60DRAFT_220035 [Aspergillus nidulans var. acristatus]